MAIAREVVMACRLGVEVFIITFNHFLSLLSISSHWPIIMVILQVAIVVGGRNFFCGDSWVTTTGLDRCTAYQIGYVFTHHLVDTKSGSSFSLYSQSILLH